MAQLFLGLCYLCAELGAHTWHPPKAGNRTCYIQIHGFSRKQNLIDALQATFRILGNVLWHYWDFAITLFFCGIHGVSWYANRQAKKGHYHELEYPKDLETIRFAATSMISSSTSGVIAVSILIPVSLFLAGLEHGDNEANPAHSFTIAKAIVWFLLSLSLGLWVIFLAPFRSTTVDARYHAPLGLCFGWQLITLLIGTIVLASAMIPLLN